MTRIRFSGPVYNDGALSGDGVYAEHTGARLPVRMELSGDGLALTLS